MDYTDLARVKAAIDNVTTTDDALLAQHITAASRELDRQITGSPFGANYFELDDVADEQGRCWVDAQGHVVYSAHKSVVNSVTALAYRSGPSDSWTDVDPDDVAINGNQITAWVNARALRSERGIQVKLSYNGGSGATIAALPADLVEAATVLAVRFYREVKAGLTDVMGVSEMGTPIYTKSMPNRIKRVIADYRRMTPW